MTTIKAFVKRHPVLTYFALTFAISWGGMLAVIGAEGFLGITEQTDILDPSLYLAMLAGPCVAGLLLTGLVDGKVGLRDLFSRLLKWRVGARWYAVALLTAPLLMTATLLVLSLTSPAFLPAIFAADDRASLLLTGIIMGLVVSFFEELGWTGFAVPKLRLRYGILTTGLLVGILWGLWHFPLFSASRSTSGSVSPALYLSVLLFSYLPAYRVLMVWVYDRTESLLVVILMHVPLAACQLVLVPPTLSGLPLVVFDVVFAAALWVVVAAVVLANRAQRTRQPLAGRPA